MALEPQTLASSLSEATVGTIITPITRPMASTLNDPVGGAASHATPCPGRMRERTGRRRRSGRRPGSPGLVSGRRSLGWAYSDSRTAEPSPSGTAVSKAIAVVQAVAVISGMTPKDASANRGAHRVPNRKSRMETSAKNSSVGMINAITIPTVIAIVATPRVAAHLRDSLTRSPMVRGGQGRAPSRPWARRGPVRGEPT